jgi:hypothetical protein
MCFHNLNKACFVKKYCPFSQLVVLVAVKILCAFAKVFDKAAEKL